MTENKFGWKVGDALVWSSPDGCDKSCVVTKATAMMIEFETEEGEAKTVKGSNPSIARIESPPKAEPTTTPGAGPEAVETKHDKAAECARVDEPAFVPSGADERISELRAEVDLKSGGVAVATVQVREGGALRAGDQEFRLAGEGEWHPSLEEALDAEYGRSWMCIRMQDG
ncbi:MAG TPA: hypothetical protein PLM24_04465 [Methanothrix sp.]|nr:hypothetical protein [Methanothrix sp.]HPJ84253.1 hypothetical protein [Methanothrix sp.]HPR66371.1 hypothetical protein [Methanothrix sp.]